MTENVTTQNSLIYASVKLAEQLCRCYVVAKQSRMSERVLEPRSDLWSRRDRKRAQAFEHQERQASQDKRYQEKKNREERQKKKKKLRANPAPRFATVKAGAVPPSQPQLQHSSRGDEQLWRYDRASGGVPLNAAHEQFYRAQPIEMGVKDSVGWGRFVSAMAKPLPVTFRVDLNRAAGVALAKRLASSEFTCMPLQRIAALEGSGENAWKVDTDRAGLRRESNLRPLHRLITREMGLGHLSRQELVSMVPALLLGALSHHRVLDMCAAPGTFLFWGQAALHFFAYCVAETSFFRRCVLFKGPVGPLMRPRPSNGNWNNIVLFFCLLLSPSPHSTHAHTIAIIHFPGSKSRQLLRIMRSHCNSTRRDADQKWRTPTGLLVVNDSDRSRVANMVRQLRRPVWHAL